MTRTAFILGGTGQIGIALARDLLAHGWDVTIGSRGKRPLPDDVPSQAVKVVEVDRDDTISLARTLGNGADALIDFTAYGARHGRQLVDLQGNVGALVVMSSSSVYRDDAGRTLDEAAQNGFPDLPDPIPETQATVAPGNATYSTRKVALEQMLLDKARVPLTILRPAAICGPGSIHPREWWFVKRMLDGRKAIPLAFAGQSRFHTSCVANIAKLARITLDRPGTRVLNIADPEALSVGEIGTTIARHLGFGGRFVPVEGNSFPAGLGRTPWSVPRPFVLDNSEALAIGYRPATDYPAAAGAICDDLTTHDPARDWKALFPILANYPYDHFDYAAEDAFLATKGQAG